MKIAITGASGFVGRHLVPRLHAAGIDLVLLGREPDRLSRLFPGLTCRAPETLAQDGHGADLLLHLAARNNNQPGPQGDFDAVNVDLALTQLRAAQEAGIGRFIYVSSIHALDASNRSAYAESKRRGAEAVLAAAGDTEVSILYLPAVQADSFAGKLAVLNTLPQVLRRPAFHLLAALRPTISIDKIAAHLLSGAPPGEDNRLILTEAQMGNRVYGATMRLVDYAFALTILLGFWWVLLAAWIAVRRDSPGPGLFGQPRVGRHGKVFTCWKFRTMQLGTAQAGTHEVSAASVTRVGAFLRRTKIDELPQVWNILRGEIALIGPRPCLPVQTELVEERRKRGVLEVLPGISGLAQVEGIDMSDPVRLARRDADYVALRGILPDIRLILRTARGGGQGDRVRGQAGSA